MGIPSNANLFTTGAATVNRRWYDNQSFYRETLRFTSTAFAAGATYDSPIQIPANHRIVAAKINNQTALVLSTAVKVGLGTSADPDGYALSSTAVTKNTKTSGGGALVNTVPLQTSAATPRITACDTSGAAAGTITSGTIACEITYDVFPAISDAA